MSDAVSLLSRLTDSGGAVQTLRATVSAYRQDGLVNLTYGTAHLYGIPCLASYTNRTIGDVVQVLDLGNNIWVVMGRIGGTDPEFPIAPIANQNTYFAQYAIATGNVVGVAEPGFEGFVGSSGSSTDQPVLLAWSYTFLTTNHLTINTAGASTISVTVARSNILHGQRDAVELQLCPHNYNLLPSASITLSTDSFSPVLFRLEVGEIRDVPLPADWVAAIQAGTPTIKGFAVQPAVTTPWEASYAIFDPISGGFRTT